jgi:hypothetical protein
MVLLEQRARRCELHNGQIAFVRTGVLGSPRGGWRSHPPAPAKPSPWSPWYGPGRKRRRLGVQRLGRRGSTRRNTFDANDDTHRQIPVATATSRPRPRPTDGSENPTPGPESTASTNRSASTCRPQDLTSFIAAGTVTQQQLDDPNMLLNEVLEKIAKSKSQTRLSTATISIATNPTSSPLVPGRYGQRRLLTRRPGRSPFPACLHPAPTSTRPSRSPSRGRSRRGRHKLSTRGRCS